MPEVTCLSQTWPWPELALASLRRLLGDEPGEFDDGRVALLVCPICADLSCRALSARLILTADCVEWRDLGWQSDYEPFTPTESGFDPPLHLRFDRTSYTTLLGRLQGRFMSIGTAHDSSSKDR
ncbi:MAG: hypothetical protein HYR62_04425 [Actinobacteria bacterium]|nr:hypothetical protein [Actinomycetota bacterium]MBI3686301.1 hypothetical protein [Actinomycetota bacterium]